MLEKTWRKGTWRAVGGTANGAATWERHRGPSKKSKVKLRAGVLRGLHPKEAEPLPCKDTCTTGFTTVLFILDGILKQPVSIGGGKDKAVHRYMHLHPKRERKREGSTIQPKKRMKFHPA